MSNTVQIDIIAVDAASNILQSIAGQFGAFGAVAVAALTAAGSAFDSLIQAGSAEEDVMTRFNALIDNSPLKSFSQSILDNAEALSQHTRYTKDDIVAVDTVLLRFQALGSEYFPKATQAALDLAAVTGQDATNSARALGRALEDPAAGLGLLVRAGVAFTEQQKEQIKTMEKSGDLMGAQKLLLDDIAKSVGGVAEKMGTDFPGQMAIFNDSLKQFWADNGVKVLDALTPLMADLNEMATYILPDLSEKFNTVFIPALKGAVQWLQNIYDMRTKIDFGQLFNFDHFIDVAKNINWTKFSDDLTDKISKLPWDKIGDAINKGISTIVIDSEKLTGVIIKAVQGINWGEIATALAIGLDTALSHAMGMSPLFTKFNNPTPGEGGRGGYLDSSGMPAFPSPSSSSNYSFSAIRSGNEVGLNRGNPTGLFGEGAASGGYGDAIAPLTAIPPALTPIAPALSNGFSNNTAALKAGLTDIGDKIDAAIRSIKLTVNVSDITNAQGAAGGPQ
jgi:hypothetical protein